MFYAVFQKMLSYRRETALQGALVLAKSRRVKLRDKMFVSRAGTDHKMRMYDGYCSESWRLKRSPEKANSCSSGASFRLAPALFVSEKLHLFIYNEIVHMVQRNDRKDKLRISWIIYNTAKFRFSFVCTL